jgi:predicted nucleic acid-binding protein
MTILDTSLVVPLFRSNSASFAQRLSDEIGDLDIFLTSVTELELLQGARDEAEWRRIEGFLTEQDIIQPAPIAWRQASRTYFDLRRVGQTVRSSFDCLIAEIAISRNAVLLHNDRDFQVIATIRPLSERRIDIGGV